MIDKNGKNHKKNTKVKSLGSKFNSQKCDIVEYFCVQTWNYHIGVKLPISPPSLGYNIDVVGNFACTDYLQNYVSENVMIEPFTSER
jgi:hypothetical protein